MSGSDARTAAPAGPVASPRALEAGAAPAAVAEELRAVVTEAAAQLHAIPHATSARRPTPGAWSVREIVGHLVDSAGHNHDRFVRAQLQDELVFPGYDQDAWVRVQRYQDADWPALVALWLTLNLRLARLVEAIPPTPWAAPRRRHNLHRIAFRTVPESEPTTLGYLVRDYVAHLRHHLAQIERTLGAPGTVPPAA